MSDNRLKILIIDDNPADLNLLKRYFSKLQGWEIEIFYSISSEEGIKQWTMYKPEIIIVDYLLGNENGIDIIQKLKSIGSRSEFILLTGYGNEAVVTEALRVGASDYLNKSNLSTLVLEKTLRHILLKLDSEAKIKKTESKLSYILEKTAIGLVIMDDTGNILNANESFLSMLGISSLDNILGRKIYEWVTSDCRTSTNEALKKCKIEGSLTDFETTFEKPTGQNSYILINALFEKEPDKNIIFAICRNITDRKIYEHELKQAKIKAEDADRLKSAFLANMSHEIRTPMNAIIGFVDLLARDNISPSDKNAYINIIKNSSNTLLNLINDIIDISKIEVGQISLNKVDFNLNQVMLDLYNTYSVKVREKLEFSFENAQEIYSSNIHSDPLRFKQIMVNLLDNAFKFTEIGTIKFGFKRTDNFKFLFYVKDTGIGIPQNKHEIIFDRFMKLDEGSQKLYRGTGLGLTISKRLVQLLDGNIWLESEPGKGSAFYFTLPNAREIDTAKAEYLLMDNRLNDSTPDWKSKTILIVEDEEMNLLFLKKLLESSQVNILECRTGKEAVEQVQKNSEIDLILMDIKLPEMDGITATRIIKSIHKDIPIIAQTAFAMKGDMEEFIEAGCNDYISKPIRLETLIKKIEFYFSPPS